jgi:hypothetical protein
MISTILSKANFLTFLLLFDIAIHYSITVASRNVSKVVECFPTTDNKNFYCGKADDPYTEHGPRWSTFLGIGPSKTGSTALFHMLKMHANVTIGDSWRGGQACCHDELYFFSDQGEFKIRYGSLAQYSSFFDDPVHKVMAGEKTPLYSIDTYAPYRVATLLQRPLKLIFTIRNELEADISLYSYRKIASKFKASYLEWLQPRVEMLNKWMKCRLQSFIDMLIPDVNKKSQYVSFTNLYDSAYFDWRTSRSIEYYMRRRCGSGHDGATTFYPIFQDYLQERLYAMNLKRWVQVFGQENILCVWNDDLLFHPAKVQAKVTEFLGLDPLGWRPNSHPPPRTGKTSWYHVLKASHDHFKATATINTAVKLFNDTLNLYVTDADREYIREFCKPIPA